MKHIKFKYITYEEPFVGKKFTEHLMKMVYKNRVDKTEYPDFESWKEDMLKSGVFERVQRQAKASRYFYATENI